MHSLQTSVSDPSLCLQRIAYRMRWGLRTQLSAAYMAAGNSYGGQTYVSSQALDTVPLAFQMRSGSKHSLVSGFHITSSIYSFATTFLIPNSDCQDFAHQIDSVLQACSGHRIIRDNSELRFPTERSVVDDDT